MMNHRKRIAALVLALILIVTPILESYAVVSTNLEAGEETNEEVNIVEDLNEGEANEDSSSIKLGENLDNSSEIKEENDENVSHKTSKDNSSGEEFKEEAKASIEIDADKNVVSSKEDAVFLINTDIEGEKEAFKDKEIILDLRDNQLSDILKDNIEELKIAGVSPDYDNEKNQLIYDLVDLKTGKTEELELRLKTDNKGTVNNEYVEVKMLYKNKEVEESLIEKEAKIQVEFEHNTVIEVKAVNEQVLSGQDAIFQIDTKFTGSKKEYEDREMVIELGDNELSDSFKLEDIKIAGVTPDYDGKTNQLVYKLDNLETGKTDRVNIRLKIENGKTPNGKEVNIKLKYYTKDGELLILEKEAKSFIKAKTNLAIAKSFQGVYDEKSKEVKKIIPQPGDILVWQADYEILINNKEYGNLFLAEGSKIRIEDQPDNNQTLLGIIENGSLNKNKKIYEIDAPAMEDQEKEEGLTLKGKVSFATRVDKNIKLNSNFEAYIDNAASISAIGYNSENLEDNTNSSSSETSYKIVDLDKLESSVPSGSAYIPAHMGPADSQGNPQGYSSATLKEGKIPVVDDSALLGFSFNFTSHGIKGVNGTYELSTDYYKDYRLEYLVDDNLILEEIVAIKGEFNYVPNSTIYGSKNIEYPDNVKPRYDIVGYDGEGKGRKELFRIKNPGKGEVFTREDLDIEDTAQVKVVAFEFDYAPVGMYLKPTRAYVPNLIFSIKEGFRGRVQNDMKLFIEGDPKAKSEFIDKNGLVYGNHNTSQGQIYHRRGADVRDRTEDFKVIGDININLENNINGKVQTGKNVLTINYKNLTISNGDMKENIGIAILPSGVKAIDSKNELSIIDNFNGSGRQLVAFELEDISRTKPISKRIDIEITDEAPNNLIFDAEIYPNIDLDNRTKKEAQLEALNKSENNTLGSYDNTIKDHKDYILGLDLENKDIFEKLLASPETYRKKLRTNTIYNLIDGYGLTTEHQISLDKKDWKNIVEVLDEDNLYYRLHVKNETDKAVSNLKIVDIFPHIGDLGITDNIPRDSEIFINDIESIQIVNKKGTDIKDKFNIYYVEEANINKDEFFEEELSGKYRPDNPEGAVNPNWKEVSSGGFKAGALKIELKPGYNLNIGEEVEVIIKVKSPVTNEVVEAIGKEKFEEVSQLTAWNSFAVSSKEFQTVEPKRVGVQIGIAESPGIKKELVGLANDSELVKGSHVKYKLSSDIGSIENVYKILIEDQLDERLEDVALSVDLINKDGEKINNTPEVLGVDDSNKIIFKTENQDLIQQLENGKINLFIEARLKANASDEWLENQATIQVNNNPKEKTEIVRIKPITPTEPVIEKTVEGDKDGIVNYGEAFKYVINNTLPNDINEYKQYRIVDKLDDRLDILDVKVLIDNINLEDSSQDIKLNQEGNEVSLIIEDLEKLKGKSEIVLVFEVKLNTNEADITIDNEVKLISENNRDGETKELTDEVRVKTPKNPEVKKSMIDLEDGQELVEGKEFSYKISTEFGKAIGYDSFILKDNLDPDLELLSAEVWVDNTKNENLSEKVSVNKDNNSVSLEIKNGWDELRDKKLDLLIKVKLKESLKEKVDNEASFKLNNNPEEKTNTVGVKPIKPTEPEIEKEALDFKNQDEKIVNYGEEFKYKITNSLPNDIEEYENYIIEDELDEALDLNFVKVTIGEAEKEFTLVDGEVSGEIKGTKLTVKDNKLELEVEGFNQLEGLEEIVLELNVKLKEDAKIENNILPNNAKVTYKHKEREEASKEDREIVKTPKDPKLSKDIEGQGLNKVIAKGSEFDYILTTKLINIEGYEKVLIRDELDERLEYISSVVKIDGKEDSDYETSYENPTVSLELNEDQIEELKDKKIEIFIRVKVKEGIEIAAIDNEAEIKINNNPEKPSNKVTINPKDPDLPNIEKEVDQDIVNYGEEFKYTLTSKLPDNLNQYGTYRITDSIDENLELISVAVKVMDEEVRTLKLSEKTELDTFASKLSVEAQKVSFEITEFDEFTEKEGETYIILDFIVKLKDNVVLERHQIDNTAELSFMRTPDGEEEKKSSNATVIVPENPGIEKELVDLNEFDKVVQGTKFAYKVSSFLDNLDNVKKITLEDELDKRLDFEKGYVELDDGTILNEDKYRLNHDKDTNRVSLVIDDKDTLESLEGKTLSLVIQVRLDYGDDISLVENQASVRVNNNPKNETEKVTVVPEKPTEPKLTKKVEDDKEGTVNYEEEFSYTLSNEIPNDIEEYKSYKILDQIDPRLEILEAKVFLDGEEIEGLKIEKESKVLKAVKGLFKKGEDFTFTEEDNLLELDILNPKRLKDKEKIDILVKVKLKDGAEEGEIKNTAFVNKQSRRDEEPKDIPSNEIVVKTPEEPDVEKTIIGLENGSQVVGGKEVSYSISTNFNDITGYKSFILSDQLDEDLEIKDAEVKVNKLRDESLTNKLEINKESNTVRLELDEDQIQSLEKKILDLVITVEVKNLEKLKDSIDNEADFKLNNNPEKVSNKVTIVPKDPTAPEINKSVDIGPEAIVNYGDNFSYTISNKLPNDIEEYLVYEISDELDENLDLISLTLNLDNDIKEFSLDELEEVVKYSGLSLSKEGRKVSIKVENFADMEAKESLDLILKVRLNKEVEDYELRNQAKLNKQSKKEEKPKDIPTNEVIVRTPETPDINKEIKGKSNYSQKKPAQFWTGSRVEYSINVPIDKVNGYEKIYISDKLDERLEIEEVKALVKENRKTVGELEALSISGNNIDLEVNDKEIIKKLEGKEIEVLIKARIKTGVDLDIIENTASIKVNNNPSKDSNTVYISPSLPIEPEKPEEPEIPEEKEKPSIIKAINGVIRLENVEIGKEYAYTVDVSIPSDINDYKKLVIEDRIDDRLLIKDVKVKADGKIYSNYSLNQSENLVTANFMDIDDLTSISHLSLEIVIELKNLDYKDGDIISNIAKIIYEYKDDEIEGDIPSNEVVIVPPINWDKEDPEDPDKPGSEEPEENPEGDGSGSNDPNKPGDDYPEGDGLGNNNPNRPGGDGFGGNDPSSPGGDKFGSGLLPKTGDASSIYTSLIGLGLILLGYVVLKKRKNA